MCDQILVDSALLHTWPPTDARGRVELPPDSHVLWNALSASVPALTGFSLHWMASRHAQLCDRPASACVLPQLSSWSFSSLTPTSLTVTGTVTNHAYLKDGSSISLRISDSLDRRDWTEGDAPPSSSPSSSSSPEFASSVLRSMAEEGVLVVNRGQIFEVGEKQERESHSSFSVKGLLRESGTDSLDLFRSFLSGKEKDNTALWMTGAAVSGSLLAAFGHHLTVNMFWV